MTTIAMENINYKDEIKQKTAKPLMWIAIMSMVMFFAGLTSAVVVSQGGGSFINIALPSAFTWSTLVIVASSISFHIGLISIKKENYGVAKVTVALTLLLGLLFVATQYSGWVSLRQAGIYAVGKSSTQEGSFLYLLTFLHVLHLVGGIVSLIVILVKTMKHKYNASNYLGVQVGITYWHFLGALWVYLFLFLNYVIA